MDADAWVHDPAHRHSVQLLHVDLYDQDAAAPVLDDARFYAACRARAGRRRGDEREPVRPRRQLRLQPGADCRGLRPSARSAACGPRAKATAWCWPGAGWSCRITPNCSSARLTSRPATAPGACRRASGCACCGRWRRTPRRATRIFEARARHDPSPRYAARGPPRCGRHPGRASRRVEGQARLARAAGLAARRWAGVGGRQRARDPALRCRSVEPARAGAPGRCRAASHRQPAGAGHRGADRVAGPALPHALPAHRPAEGRCRARRRRDVGALCRKPLRAAGADEQQRRGHRHQRALRCRLGRRDRGPHPARREAGAGQSAGRAQVHHRVLCARQVGARGAEDRRGLGRGQLRATGRTRQDEQAARRQRPGRGAGGRLAVAVRLRPARQRHPPRAAARHGRHPLPHRRRAAHRLPGAAGRDERDDLAHQAARPHGRGRAPPPARRAHQDQAPGHRRQHRRRGRDAPVDAAHGLRREDGDAHLRPRDGGEEHRGAGLRRARHAALAGADRPAARHHPRHRAHRFGQDDDAVLHAQATGHRGRQRLHHRRPDRDDRAVVQPDAGACGHRHGLRRRACAR